MARVQIVFMGGLSEPWTYARQVVPSGRQRVDNPSATSVRNLASAIEIGWIDVDPMRPADLIQTIDDVMARRLP